MNNTEMITIDNVLIVNLPREISDIEILEMQQVILETVSTAGSKAVIVNTTQLELIDSYMCRLLTETAKMIKLMGADIFLVGIQAMVALTMVEMGLEINGVRTVLDVDSALQEIESRRKGTSWRGEVE